MFFYETDIPSSIIELFPSTDFIFPTKKYEFCEKSLGNGKDKMLSVILITPMSKNLMKSNKNFRKKPKILYGWTVKK